MTLSLYVTLDIIHKLGRGTRTTSHLEYSRVLGMATEDVRLEVPLVSRAMGAQRTRVAAFARVCHKVMLEILPAIATLELLPTHRALEFHNRCCGGKFKAPM